VVGDQCFELIGERGEPARERLRAIGLDLAIGDVGQAISVGANNSPARRSQSRVQAEDGGQPSRSSSSSGTS
jgi:hypothetical protein